MTRCHDGSVETGHLENITFPISTLMSRWERSARLFPTYVFVPADAAKYQPELSTVEAVQNLLFCDFGHFDYYIVSIFVA